MTFTDFALKFHCAFYFLVYMILLLVLLENSANDSRKKVNGSRKKEK